MGEYWFDISDYQNGCRLWADTSHSVNITWPDGRVEVFEFRPVAVDSGYSGGGSCAFVALVSYDFENISGGTSKLRLTNTVPQYWYTDVNWLTDAGGDLWEPTEYTLETVDGTLLTFSKFEDAIKGVKPSSV